MTILGSDVSHYDASDTRKMFTEGIVFQTHKAGGDSGSGDPELASWWKYASTTDPAKILLGSYWVPRPDLYSDPSGEALRWIATLDQRCPGWRLREHILQMDAEIWNGNPRTKPGKAYLQELGGRLVEIMPKLMPICYASAGQYGDSLAGLTFPFWNARYPLGNQTGTAAGLYARCGGDSGKGWGAYSGKVPAVWQYTSSATIGGQTTCDANAFRGTLDQLKRLVAPGWAGEDIVAIDITDVKKIWQTDGLIVAPANADSAATNPSWAPSSALTDASWFARVNYALLKTIAEKVSADPVDEQAIVSGILAGLGPAALTDAVVDALKTLPAETAKATVDEITARLSGNVQ